MIIQADILKWSDRYAGDLFHAAFMDSPYEMQFMGKGWDNSGIAFRPETWDAIARHLHPGGWIVSFGGSRTWHRMACAMEDAGLIIQPTMFLWSYAQGFPKATRPDAHIDARAFRDWLASHPTERAYLQSFRDRESEARRAKKADPCPETDALLRAAQKVTKQIIVELKEQAGLSPEVIGQKRHQPKFAAAELGYREKDNGYNSKERESFNLTAPATALARDWAGHRYGGQAIKPAVEPIIFAQKPYDGPPVESMVRTGAGALWIDGARIGTDGGGTHCTNRNALGQCLGHKNAGRSTSGETFHGPDSDGGRWPSNLALCHLPSCNGDCAPGCPVAALGAQSGESEATRSIRVDRNTKPGYDGGWKPLAIERGHDDTGTAARFFYQSDWQYERLEQADPVGYFAKASRSEREAGLDDMQVRLLREWYGDDIEEFNDAVDSMAVYGDYAGTPEHGSNMGSRRFDTATINDGRPTPIDNPYQRGETKRKNIHPTVKPIALSRWLATLLLPPARYAPRRLLVPFAGVASEYIGAMLAGWEQIEGIELEESHVKIARARIAYWEQLRYRLMNPDEPIKLRPGAKVPDGQLELF